MPALEALQDKFLDAHCQILGMSVDSLHSHFNWAESLGGISFPLLADFHPKGEVGQKYGLYVDAAGLDARSTVLIDASGKVVWAEMADGQRDMDALLQKVQELDAGYEGPREDASPPEGLGDDTVLYVKSRCGFSAAVLTAMANLHLQDKVPVKNVTESEDAMAEMKSHTGMEQAPALYCDGEAMLESRDIIAKLLAKTTRL